MDGCDNVTVACMSEWLGCCADSRSYISVTIIYYYLLCCCYCV